MKGYLIERDIPGIDSLEHDLVRGAAASANAGLATATPA